MSMMKYVRDDYREYVELHRFTMPRELYESLKTHERIPTLFDNLSRELDIIEKRLGLDRMKIKSIVYDMTKVFINMLRVMADEKSLSDAEKTRRVNEALAKKMISEELAMEYQKNLEVDKVVMGVEK